MTLPTPNPERIASRVANTFRRLKRDKHGRPDMDTQSWMFLPSAEVYTHRASCFLRPLGADISVGARIMLWSSNPPLEWAADIVRAASLSWEKSGDGQMLLDGARATQDEQIAIAASIPPLTLERLRLCGVHGITKSLPIAAKDEAVQKALADAARLGKDINDMPQIRARIALNRLNESDVAVLSTYIPTLCFVTPL